MRKFWRYGLDLLIVLCAAGLLSLLVVHLATYLGIRLVSGQGATQLMVPIFILAIFVILILNYRVFTHGPFSWTRDRDFVIRSAPAWLRNSVLPLFVYLGILLVISPKLDAGSGRADRDLWSVRLTTGFGMWFYLWFCIPLLSWRRELRQSDGAQPPSDEGAASDRS